MLASRPFEVDDMVGVVATLVDAWFEIVVSSLSDIVLPDGKTRVEGGIAGIWLDTAIDSVFGLVAIDENVVMVDISDVVWLEIAVVSSSSDVAFVEARVVGVANVWFEPAIDFVVDTSLVDEEAEVVGDSAGV